MKLRKEDKRPKTNSNKCMQVQGWTGSARSIVAVMLVVLFFSANALAQEATQTAPWAYKLQFENEWVRVIRVHYEPHEKLPPHAHTKWPCVYVGRTKLQGRYYREPSPAAKNYRKVQFENEQLRVTRLRCAPRKRLGVVAGASEPALLVSLSAAPLRTKSGTNKTTLGQTVWLTGGRPEGFENLGDAPMEWLRFDLKTAPVTAPETNAERQQSKGRKTEKGRQP